MSIYLNINKILSKKKHIQKSALAEALGVSRNTITNWLSKEVGIKAEQVPKIAKALHVSISELYGTDTLPVKIQELSSKEKGKVELLKEQLKEERLENKKLSIEIDRLKMKKVSSPSVVEK